MVRSGVPGNFCKLWVKKNCPGKVHWRGISDCFCKGECGILVPDTSQQRSTIWSQNGQCHVHLQSTDYCLCRQDLVCQKRGSDTTALGSSFPVKRYHMFPSHPGRSGLIETLRPALLGRGVESGQDTLVDTLDPLLHHRQDVPLLSLHEARLLECHWIIVTRNHVWGRGNRHIYKHKHWTFNKADIRWPTLTSNLQT